ncbi:hypothetical protein [Kibdelosporangium phytohabitans]|uniref:Uncharacterized protein n=1 Tax=Kibdelosporangium phytohabitans TaxID=860235 RepID=A0A0N9HWW2_9PSEU|nr:hypothetical protein [Kibdelosporangium phytohabitans]ALG07645.1 hypothetical protein AOZ06_12660 [Kibdelosporangium phytohabitans]ALG07701.1 hypothetical protein AOZ06_12980 [Kibdelosporangium phytohabitans]MBE1471401.1 hypothetical protein [Kibdelosporangium phytohabitans]
MPDQTVLQQAASVARLLGHTRTAARFADVLKTHAAQGCPVDGIAPCTVEQYAREYLDEHTDGPNTVVLHIEPDLSSPGEDHLTRVRRRWREAERDNAALVEQVEQRDQQIAAYRELLGCIWLYVNWRYVTKQLETVQKELWADAVEQWQPDGSDDPPPPRTVDRWWRDDAPATQPLVCGACCCAIPVHKTWGPLDQFTPQQHAEIQQTLAKLGADLTAILDSLKPEPTLCGAVEGATGIKCDEPERHRDDHTGTSTAQQNASVGYQLTVTWPRQPYDTCATEATP